MATGCWESKSAASVVRPHQIPFQVTFSGNPSLRHRSPGLFNRCCRGKSDTCMPFHNLCMLPLFPNSKCRLPLLHNSKCRLPLFPNSKCSFRCSPIRNVGSPCVPIRSVNPQGPNPWGPKPPDTKPGYGAPFGGTCPVPRLRHLKYAVKGLLPQGCNSLVFDRLSRR